MDMSYRVAAVRASSSTSEVEVELEEASRSTIPARTLGPKLEATFAIGAQPKVGTRYRVLLVDEDGGRDGRCCVHCHRDPQR